MTSEGFNAKRLSQLVTQSQKRLDTFRKSRLMYIRSYTGPYYAARRGKIGDEALNLAFTAVRALVPNLVFRSPRHVVKSRVAANKDFAELLELALSQHDEAIDIGTQYRIALVDALFAIGTLKTGIAVPDNPVALDETMGVAAPGEIYTKAVNFDRLIIDPDSREHHFADAAFIGDIISVSKTRLLDSGLYDNEVLEQVPTTSEHHERYRSDRITLNRNHTQQTTSVLDQVELAELWIPSRNVVVTLPIHGPNDKFVREDTFYGVEDGPYTFLSLTPPVPGNPLPVAPAAVWQDLHVLANRMASKIVTQAARQKDVMTYRAEAADDAAQIRDASDGDMVAVEDVDSLRVQSFGGQRVSNEGHINTLATWFQSMAANPQQLEGQAINADSATAARILADSANVGLSDMQEMVSKMAAGEARKRAWYMMHDPLIRLPLIRRRRTPIEGAAIPGLGVIDPVQQPVDEQVLLTPEARRGEFMDYNFTVDTLSLQRQDPQLQFDRSMRFLTQVIPAVAQAAIALQQIGVPFNIPALVERVAKESGIEYLDEVFFDPQFQQRQIAQLLATPQPPPEGQRITQPPGARNPTPGLAEISQNRQPGSVRATPPSQDTQDRSAAQQGAAADQSRNRLPGDQAFR